MTIGFIPAEFRMLPPEQKTKKASTCKSFTQCIQRGVKAGSEIMRVKLEYIIIKKRNQQRLPAYVNKKNLLNCLLNFLKNKLLI